MTTGTSESCVVGLTLSAPIKMCFTNMRTVSRATAHLVTYGVAARLRSAGEAALVERYHSSKVLHQCSKRVSRTAHTANLLRPCSQLVQAQCGFYLGSVGQ
jgi:hypothetical protein